MDTAMDRNVYQVHVQLIGFTNPLKMEVVASDIAAAGTRACTRLVERTSSHLYEIKSLRVEYVGTYSNYLGV